MAQNQVLLFNCIPDYRMTSAFDMVDIVIIDNICIGSYSIQRTIGGEGMLLHAFACRMSKI